jgi:hypothetical protein
MTTKAKQLECIKDALQKGKTKEQIFQKMDFFGIDESEWDDIISGLLNELKPISIEQIDRQFKGLQLSTHHDLNQLMSQGWTGDWEIDHKRLKKGDKLRMYSMEDRGLYFEATITHLVRLSNKKSLVYFHDPILQRLPYKNIKFTRNVVRIISPNIN